MVIEVKCDHLVAQNVPLLLVDVLPQVPRQPHYVGEGGLQVLSHAWNEVGNVGEVPLQGVEQTDEGFDEDRIFCAVVLDEDYLSLVQEGHEHLHQHGGPHFLEQQAVLVVF